MSVISSSSKDLTGASLVLVGSGIKFVAQLTVEAKAYLEQSPHVLYLLNEPALEHWLQSKNPNAQSLQAWYDRYPSRADSYAAITQAILEKLAQVRQLCVVVYGHPTVLAQSGLAAALQAQEWGAEVKVLPGISAADCLFADLMVDPGRAGCQFFEAPDLLVYQRKLDPSQHLIIWQAGVIGMWGYYEEHDNQNGANLLRDYLLNVYPENHGITLYEAAQYPGFTPTIATRTVKTLADATIARLATLYVAPNHTLRANQTILAQLNYVAPETL